MLLILVTSLSFVQQNLSQNMTSDKSNKISSFIKCHNQVLLFKCSSRVLIVYLLNYSKVKDGERVARKQDLCYSVDELS